ncbi:Telomere end binding protein [Penicillium alfredii]|uniref:Telomere end binding protein n=1 Tax=Penicillium alfredii TaxID=1506179 RepID=A0A9W9FQU2_9EURO|nr:Telomere end binding protein [Penicillium alfredii]KAJ5104652.1 Telomere end binding protein [Penicillium alfredii]
MDATDPSPAPNVLAHLTKAPIAALSPTLEQPEEKCILANVTLVWPYSSSTRSISLLLSEPDFRLRRSNGQVKVVFHWHVAERVAESHVGIGDSVCLALRGSKWVANETATQTPGKYVAWDAHFESGVSIESHVPVPSVAEFAPPTTPGRISMDPEIDGAPGIGSWGSPAFSKSSRKSFGEALDSAFDPFAEEDGSVPGKGRKRPRFSLRREEWRIVDEPESPREREGTVDWEHELDEEEKLEKEANQADTNVEPENDIPIPDAVENYHSPELTSYESAPVFAKPSLELTGSILERRAEQSANTASSGPVNLAEQDDLRATFRLPTDTPHLQPIPSPGLPIPSPLVPNQNHPQGYFSSMSAATQAQDIPSIPEEIRPNTTTNSTVLPRLTPPSPLQAADISAAHAETAHQNPPIDSFELFTHPSASTSFPGHVPAEINGEVPTSFEEEVHPFESRGNLEMHTADIDMGNADDQMQFPSAAEGVIRRSVEENDQEDWGGNEKNEDEDEEAEEAQGSNMVSMEEEEFGAQDGFQPEVQPQDLPHSTSSPELDEENGDIPEAEEEPRDYEPEAIEIPEDKADVSPEVMVRDRSHSLTYSEDERDPEAADEALQHEEASDSASPDDYDNDFQTEAEVPEELGYESEEEHDSLPPPTQHEVIVLDSDSDDELASEQPVATPSQPPRPQNRSYHEGLSTLSAVAEFAMDGNDEAWSVIGEELDNEGPKSEEEDDDQVHETDTDESSVDELARDHYDFRGREVSAEDQDDDQSMEAKSEEIAANSGGVRPRC